MSNLVDKITRFDAATGSYDLGILLLRLWVGFTIFVGHGLEKLHPSAQMMAHYPDPLHLGQHVTWIITLTSDVICSLLVAAGLATRLATLFIMGNLFVAYTLVFDLHFFKPGNAQLVFVLWGTLLAILVTGPGQHSIDLILARRLSAKAFEPTGSRLAMR